MNHNVDVANILDNFHDNNRSLIFLTTALRSMFETGNVNEPNLDEGVYSYMSDITDKFLQLEQSVNQFIKDVELPTTSAPPAGLTAQNDKEQKT